MIYVTKFRTNDLHESKGKQIEFNKGVNDALFNFTQNEHDILFECYSVADKNVKQNINAHLSLSQARGDYKIYQNADGNPDLKDFFLNTLRLTSANVDDYFAIKKSSTEKYKLYYIPKESLFTDFYAIASGDQFLFMPDNEQPEAPLFMSKQVIFYGAPGTGKSHSVNKLVDEAKKKKLVFRTTFHPDSDYSTFVGAYKPTMYLVPERFQSVQGAEKAITYNFVPQAFLQAYIAAWQNPNDKVFLVIEEINRGNCAQIFGDLFQLLDRDNNGESEYPIKADKDIAKYLKDDIKLLDGITDDELRLPSNLYIIATMNTSDQSLFPIDSAFKRRWEWKYIPIAKGRNMDGTELNWTIGNTGINWWSFLEKINAKIFETTNSEDKKLGFFFVKAEQSSISIETFLSKVIFYLWNDVYKDYGFDDDIFSIGDYKPIKFPDFFNIDGSPKENIVEMFIRKVCGNNEIAEPQGISIQKNDITE